MDEKFENEDLVVIDGIIETVMFENKDNGYTVCLLETEDELITAVGIMPCTQEGEIIRAQGKWETHPSYGKQFRVVYYEKQLPATGAAMIKYLSSGIIKGIGKKTAEKIVSLKDAGFGAVMEAEAAGYRDLYIDVTHFWGLEEGWLSVSDKTPLLDAAMPSGCEEMYLTAEYLYLTYLAEGGSQTMFQTEFVGIPQEEGEKLTMEDVGLIDSDGSLVLILRQPVTPTYLALTLGNFRVARENGMGSCGPYRVVWADSTQIQLEPNPHWTGEKPIYDMVRCHAG